MIITTKKKQKLFVHKEKYTWSHAAQKTKQVISRCNHLQYKSIHDVDMVSYHATTQ